MYKNSLTEIPYEDIDFEIVNLIREINKIDGVETTESCFGHNERPCIIFLKFESIDVLNQFIFKYFDCESLWKLELDLGDVNKNWKDIHMILHSGEYKDFPTVNLMVDNLTYRFKTKVVTE